MTSQNKTAYLKGKAFFHNQEQPTITSPSSLTAASRNISTTQQVKSFTRGYSPITGAPLHRANIAGTHLLDCPDERMVFISYDELYQLMTHTFLEDNAALTSWYQFLNQTKK